MPTSDWMVTPVPAPSWCLDDDQTEDLGDDPGADREVTTTQAEHEQRGAAAR